MAKLTSKNTLNSLDVTMCDIIFVEKLESLSEFFSHVRHELLATRAGCTVLGLFAI